MEAPEVMKLCRTCEHTHCKDYEFPCRDCCDRDRWEFASRDKWPMFPLKPDPWATQAERKEE